MKRPALLLAALAALAVLFAPRAEAFVYWGNGGGPFDPGTMIGRANLNGTPPPPSNEFGFGKLSKQKRKGKAKLWLNVAGPGVVELAGRRIKRRTKHTAGPRQRLSVAPTGKAKRKLNKKSRRRGRAKVRVRVRATYTPDGGTPSTKSKRVGLIRRR